MTAPTLVVTWALVKSGALTSWMSAWTASLTGHLYTNIIVMMILFCFTTCKRSNWEGKNYYWCHSEHDNFFHSKLCFLLPLLPNSALVFKIVFWRIWEFIVSSLAKINNHFQIIKYISLIPQHYNLTLFISSWATKSCPGFCHVRIFTYLSVAKRKQAKL